ncbi:MBL fold metallo-hydrolase [Methylibium sp.]|uniref:MBL fold metallo-hydrolase n=1 Tax=Methylibium sp. TaxID=2067992 RepID=UPI003D13D36C
MNPDRRFFLRFQTVLLCAGLGLGAAGAAAQTATELAVSPPLELVVLGSGGPGAAGRAASCYMVLVDGVPRILVDAGPGSFARLGEAKLSLARTDLVLLTHLHVDHVGELPGLLKARAVSSRGPIAAQVFGPEGRRAAKRGDASFPSTRRLIDLLFGPQGAFGYLRDFSAPLTIKATDIGTALLPNPQPKVIHSEGDLVIRAVAGHHRDAPAVIYRIDHGGKSITFSGDIDAEGLPGLRRIAKGSDLLVFNSVVLDPPGSPAILYTLHTPPKAIGEVARDSGSKQLLLSHLSPFLDQSRAAVEASITQAFQGPVVFAEDGRRLVP